MSGRGGSGDKRRRLRLAAACAGCAALLPVLAACGIQPTGITSLGAAPAAATISPLNGLPSAVGSNQYALFFYQGNRLTAVYRSTSVPATESLVLRELLLGPTSSERAQGYSTALPTNLVAKPNAEQERYAFALSESLGSRGRSEFICTMQYIDGTNSIGTEITGSGTGLGWLSCSDTTAGYVPMPGGAATTPPGQ